MTSPVLDENALLRRVEAIERQLRELGPSVAKSVQSIVAGLIRGGYANQAQEVGFSLPTSPGLTPVVSTLIEVPEGYARGIVVAAGWCAATNISGGTDNLRVGVSVDGNTPASVTVYPSTPHGSTAAAQVLEITYLEGLTPGGTVSIEGVTASSGATPWGTSTNMYVQGFAIFFV